MNRYKKDLKVYLRAHKVAEQLIDIIENKRDLEVGDKELSELLVDEDRLKKFKDRLYKGSVLQNICNDKLSQDLAISESKKLLEEIAMYENRRKLFRYKVAKLSIIAAVIFISMVLWHQNKDIFNGEIKQNNQLYKVDVPTLISAYGEVVPLSDSVNIEDYLSDVNIVNKSSIKEGEIINKVASIGLNTVIVPKGYTYNVLLPDSSIVTLNAGSELKYPTIFSDSSRIIELVGEALFEIRKDDRAMIVNVGNSKIKVYGTRFNVNYSQELNRVESVLINGSIGISNDEGDEIIMVPNQKISYNYDTNNLKIESVNVSNYIAWTDGYFSFTDRPLCEIVDAISKWYGIEIVLGDEIKSDILTINLKKTNSEEQIVRFLDKVVNGIVVKDRMGKYSINQKVL